MARELLVQHHTYENLDSNSLTDAIAFAYGVSNHFRIQSGFFFVKDVRGNNEADSDMEDSDNGNSDNKAEKIFELSDCSLKTG